MHLMSFCNGNIKSHLLDNTSINLLLYFKLECVDAQESFVSPYTGKTYEKCEKADSWLCRFPWYKVKCLALCDNCGQGTDSV